MKLLCSAKISRRVSDGQWMPKPFGTVSTMPPSFAHGVRTGSRHDGGARIQRCGGRQGDGAAAAMVVTATVVIVVVTVVTVTVAIFGSVQMMAMHDSIQFNAMQCNAMQCNAMQCNAIDII
jgi:hypothetical protein